MKEIEKISEKLREFLKKEGCSSIIPFYLKKGIISDILKKTEIFIGEGKKDLDLFLFAIENSLTLGAEDYIDSFNQEINKLENLLDTLGEREFVKKEALMLKENLVKMKNVLNMHIKCRNKVIDFFRNYFKEES